MGRLVVWRQAGVAQHECGPQREEQRCSQMRGHLAQLAGMAPVHPQAAPTAAPTPRPRLAGAHGARHLQAGPSGEAVREDGAGLHRCAVLGLLPPVCVGSGRAKQHPTAGRRRASLRCGFHPWSVARHVAPFWLPPCSADLVDNYISLKRRGKELKPKKVRGGAAQLAACPSHAGPSPGSREFIGPWLLRLDLLSSASNAAYCSSSPN